MGGSKRAQPAGAARKKAKAGPLLRPAEPVGQPWPELNCFLVPPEIDWANLLRGVLAERGWTVETPCHAVYDDASDRWTVFLREFEATLRQQTPRQLFGAGAVQEGHKLRTVKLPAHALWLMSVARYRVPGAGERSYFREDFLRTLLDHGAWLKDRPGQYRISKFAGLETAFFKTNHGLAFREKDWYPVAYVLPYEKQELLSAMAAGGSSASNLWIAKPKNEYAGAGIRVYSGGSPDLQKIVADCDETSQKRSVVQRYVANPLLIGGYKFHMRIHLAITSLDPPEGFVQENGQCLFATKLYTLSKKTIGRNFDPPVHVTNMGLNATPENKANFLKHKPVIGKGQQLRMRELEAHLAKTHPGYSKDALWRQITVMAAATVRYIARAPTVKRHASSYLPGGHFEICGMDLMLDEDLKVWMCEVNNDPGLDFPDKEVLGSPNPDYAKENRACADTWHDIFALLGYDAGRPQAKGSLKNWYQLDFSEA